MGLSVSYLSSPWGRLFRNKASNLTGYIEISVLLKFLSLRRHNIKKTLHAVNIINKANGLDWFSGIRKRDSAASIDRTTVIARLPGHGELAESPVHDKEAAATQLQKFYKSYRTRRNLADCAVVVEELWWKALDFAALSNSSISFFSDEKPQTATSRWARAITRAAKVGKGLSKDEKAQKLALRHWLEAIDPRHRYGHNLHQYYDIWFNSVSNEPFFYWLDIGSGKEVNLEKCPRIKLQHQCIRYLGPKERRAYEVVVNNGKLIYKQTQTSLNSVDGSKWIFVLSTSRKLYIAQKEKGKFQHSSFLSGGATTSAGRLVVVDGVLKAIWPYSGHYLPTEENFKEFINFLLENNVDLSNVKKCSIDDDVFPILAIADERSTRIEEEITEEDRSSEDSSHGGCGAVSERSTFGHSGTLPCKWSSGVGPRIGCVRDYPVDLQFMALEQVKLSPRTGATPTGNKGPIPSPRPSPRMRLSPRLAQMGIPSPRVSLFHPKSKERGEHLGIPSPRVSLSLPKSRKGLEHVYSQP
ncbi:IQ domain-containing protein IQM1-like [Wolffia australiana]